MEFKDYYATLGIPKSASTKEVKQAFRKLARKFHPDVNPGDKEAERQFKELNEANEVLSDPEKRRKYDELGSNWRMYEQAQQRGDRGPFGGSGPRGGRTMSPEEMEELFGGQGPFSDFFTTFFGGEPHVRAAGSHGRRRQRPARDVQHQIELTLEEAFHGVTRRLALSEGGTTRTVDVRIPKGVRHGSRIRVAGEGERGAGGAANGDLYLAVQLLPHARFELRGQDVYVSVPVPAPVSVCGGQATVPTLSGKQVRLRIPPLTSTGKLFRLKGYGMPVASRPSETGDAYARIEVKLPTTLTQQQLFEALARLQETAGAPSPNAV